MKYSVLTISDSAFSGTNKDLGGPLIIDIMGSQNILIEHMLVADEIDDIEQALKTLCEDSDNELILTTGGTGIGPRDVTPEATKNIIEYEIPGIPELMRIKNYPKTDFVALSRAVAGVFNKKLIVNFPGSPKAVKENLEVLLPLLPHSIDLIKGNTDHKEIKR